VRAVTIDDGRLVVAERPDPEPGRGELLVRVAAAGRNGADLHQLRGGYPAPPGSPADIPGLELAGGFPEVVTTAHDLRELMARRSRVLASNLRSRPLEEKADAARRVERQVLPLLADGRLRVPVAATFALEGAQQADDRFTAGGKLGKLVLVT
jgi:NADPH:quinone reductase-like Zn-dependent oxidoreductase